MPQFILLLRGDQIRLRDELIANLRQQIAILNSMIPNFVKSDETISEAQTETIPLSQNDYDLIAGHIGAKTT